MRIPLLCQERNKRILFITGVTGFLGQNLFERILKEKQVYKIYLLIRNKKKKGNIKRIKQSPQQRIIDILKECKIEHTVLGKKITINSNRTIIKVIEGDVAQSNLNISENFHIFQDITEIWHLAAFTKFDETLRELTNKTNVEGTKNILLLAKGLPNLKCLYFVSSAYVAGDKEELYEILEKPEEFHNSYEESKFVAETLISQSEIPYIIYRPSIITGRSINGELPNNFDWSTIYGPVQALDWFRKLIHGDIGGNINLRVIGNNNTTLNIIPVDFVVKMMINISSSPKSKMGEIYHLVNPGYVKLGLLREISLEITNTTGIKFNPSLLFPNFYEYALIKRLKPFNSYMLKDGPKFDYSNTQSILGESFIREIPKPNSDLIRTLYGYANSRNWGFNNSHYNQVTFQRSKTLIYSNIPNWFQKIIIFVKYGKILYK